MVDILKMLVFHGVGNEDPEQHQFFCERVWDANNVQDENAKMELPLEIVLWLGT